MSTEFFAALAGSVVGGLFALFGAWLHLRHTDRRAAHLVMRRLRNDIGATLRSYAFWESQWDRQHHSGKFFSPRAITPIELAGRADADLLLLPRPMRDRIFEINAAIAAFNSDHVPANADFVDSLDQLRPARAATERITHALSALNTAAAKRLREPDDRSVTALSTLRKK